jgi:WD40 repeat protein
MPDGRILSWSEDTTLRLWRNDGTPDGEPWRGHTRPVTGALVMPDGRILSWSGDYTLRLWRNDGMPDGEPLRGHTSSITGALVMPDGRIISWDAKNNVCCHMAQNNLYMVIRVGADRILSVAPARIVAETQHGIVVYDLRLDRLSSAAGLFCRSELV